MRKDRPRCPAGSRPSWGLGWYGHTGAAQPSTAYIECGMNPPHRHMRMPMRWTWHVTDGHARTAFTAWWTAPAAAVTARARAALPKMQAMTTGVGVCRSQLVASRAHVQQKPAGLGYTFWEPFW